MRFTTSSLSLSGSPRSRTSDPAGWHKKRLRFLLTVLAVQNVYASSFRLTDRKLWLMHLSSLDDQYGHLFVLHDHFLFRCYFDLGSCCVCCILARNKLGPAFHKSGSPAPDLSAGLLITLPADGKSQPHAVSLAVLVRQEDEFLQDRLFLSGLNLPVVSMITCSRNRYLKLDGSAFRRILYRIVQKVDQNLHHQTRIHIWR